VVSDWVTTVAVACREPPALPRDLETKEFYPTMRHVGVSNRGAVKWARTVSLVFVQELRIKNGLP
jgi:hypothetical protein